MGGKERKKERRGEKVGGEGRKVRTPPPPSILAYAPGRITPYLSAVPPPLRFSV